MVLTKEEILQAIAYLAGTYQTHGEIALRQWIAADGMSKATRQRP
jgi:hypothetical protein